MSEAKNLIHENIDIKNIKDGRKKIVRQDRIEADNCWLDIDGKKLVVLNYSSFGLALTCDDLTFQTCFEKSTELFDVSFIYQNTEIQQLHLRFIRHDATENGKRVALEIVGAPLEVERIRAVDVANKLIRQHDSFESELSLVPSEFRRDIYEIKDWLETLKVEVEKIEEALPLHDSANTLYQETITQLLANYLGEQVPKRYAGFYKSLGKASPEQAKVCVDFFRRQLHHLLYQSPFAHRSYSKPLGYAGDYEMMNIIYRNEGEGRTLFAKCLHQYFVNEPSARAVRNRAHYLHEKIKNLIMKTKRQEPLSLLSVASGPAMEVQLLLNDNSIQSEQKVVFNFLDQDEGSLKHAQNKLKTLSVKKDHKYEFRFVNKAIKNLIGRGIEGEYDLIYSAGLFDYLSEPVAQVTAQRLYAALKPGGALIIGNFNVGNPNLPVMDFVLDWQLLYRSEDDLNRLFSILGGDLYVEREPQNINLFCVITKTK